MLPLTGCQSVMQSVEDGSENGQAGNIVTELPEIADLEAVFTAILQGVAKDDTAGYPIDENFLMWLTAECGDAVVRQLAWNILDGEMTTDRWYELTGESMHVLWLRYCDDTGFQSYQVANVLWMDCKDKEETVISFTGDINFAEDW